MAAQEDDDDWDKDSNDGAAERKQQHQPLPQQKGTLKQQAEVKNALAKKTEEDDDDWDKDSNDGQQPQQAVEKQSLPQQKDTFVKKQAVVKSAPAEIPTQGVSEKAEACDWDSDGEEKKVKIPEGPVTAPKKAEPTQAQKPAAKPHIPEGPVKNAEAVEASGWDDEDAEAAKQPAGKLEPSGFDDETDKRKAVALVFDMSPEKPRKEMPKHLQERLSSRPKSAKKSRATEGDAPTTEPIDKKELARQMRKKSRTIVAPTKEKKEEKKEEQRALPPPRMKPHMANRAMAMNKPSEEVAGEAVAA